MEKRREKSQYFGKITREMRAVYSFWETGMSGYEELFLASTNTSYFHFPYAENLIIL